MEEPQINVQQPGPKSEPWLKRSSTSAISRNFGFKTIFSKAKGIYLQDVDGNQYMTFSASSHHLGYCHPEIMAAAKEQLEMTGVGRIKGLHPTLIKFTEQLLKIAPTSLMNGKVAFANTGSDAGEFLYVLARAYTGKSMAFAHMGAHHGFGVASMSFTADRSEHRRPNFPLFPGIIHVPYPNCYRCGFGQKYPDCDFLCIEHIRHTFATVAHPKETSSFFIESIRSQGVVVPPIEYFPALKELLDEHEILLVDDEAMVGFGRVGTMWSLDYWGVEPDMMYMAKSVANGMPMAPVIATPEIMTKEEQLSVIRGGTYSGNLMACAVAIAHLEVLQKEKLVENAADVGNYLITRLKEVTESSQIVGDVRGKGLFIGIELVKDKLTKTPAPEETGRVTKEAFRRGLLIGSSGVYSNVLRLIPPLIITKEEAEVAVTIIEAALKTVEKTL